MSGEETSVGAIVGYLRLDPSQWNEELDKAEAKADELGRRDPKIRIELNSAEIIAKLDAVTAAVTAMDKNQTRLTLNGNQSLKSLERAYAGLGDGAAAGASRATVSMESMAAASRRLEDATGKVAVAEQRLAEVESNSASKASQVLSAKNALTRARRAEQDAIFGTYDANLKASAASEKAAAATDKATEATRKSADENKRAAQNSSALVTAIIALGPALVPIAGGATAAAIGLGGMGTAGILAIAGIKDQMAKGTAEGLTYKSTLDGAKASVMGLAATAATNVLGPLEQAIGALDSRLPSLNSEFGLLATATGKVGASVVDGLLSAFVQLSPMMNMAATYAVQLAARFDSMMSGPGVKSFGDYAMSVFPQVMATVESLVTGVAHLVAAFAPLGGGVLSEVKLLSDALTWLANLSPSGLTAVATGVGSIAIGFKAWQGLSGLVSGLGGALEKVGFSAETAAGGIRALEIASGVIGIALAGLSIIMASGAEDTRQNQQAVDDLTQALIASNGVLDEHVRKVQYDSLQSSGVVDTYKALGGSVRDLTDAALGNADAQGRVNAVLAAAKPAADDYGQAGVDVNGVTVSLTDATNKVSTALGDANGQLKAGQTAQKDYADATKVASGVTSDQGIAAQNLADRYGVTTTAIDAATAAQQKTADQAEKAKAQMILENDAAGLLKLALDALNPKALDLGAAQTSAASATLSMTSALKQSKGSLDLNAQAGVAARQSIEGKVRADQALAEATAKATGATDGGSASLAVLKKNLENTLRAQGLLTPAVQAYIDKIYAIPKSASTKATADTKAAEAAVHTLDDDIRTTMRDRQANLYINVTSNVNAAVASVQSAVSAIGASVLKGKATGGQIEGRANGGPVPGFAGGTLIGPGTGTSDSIMAIVAETGKLLRVSAGEFVSTDASRRRNLLALEAGNRGAVLQVAGQGTGSLNLRPESPRGTAAAPVARTYSPTFVLQPTDPYAIARESARIYDMLGA